MPYSDQPIADVYSSFIHGSLGRWMREKEKYLDLWPASLSKTFTLGLRFRLDHIFHIQWLLSICIGAS